MWPPEVPRQLKSMIVATCSSMTATCNDRMKVRRRLSTRPSSKHRSTKKVKQSVFKSKERQMKTPKHWVTMSTSIISERCVREEARRSGTMPARLSLNTPHSLANPSPTVASSRLTHKSPCKTITITISSGPTAISISSNSSRQLSV